MISIARLVLVTEPDQFAPVHANKTSGIKHSIVWSKKISLRSKSYEINAAFFRNAILVFLMSVFVSKSIFEPGTL